jgi:hypothetical protein
MWKTLQIWLSLNQSLRHHPFHYLSALKTLPRRKRRRNNIQTIFLGMCGVIASWLILTGQVNIIFLVGSILLVGGIQILLLISATSGAYLAGKIVNRMTLIEKTGMSDLIAITPDGGEKARWVMGRIIYQNMKWLKIAEWLLLIAIIIYSLIGFINGNNMLPVIVVYLWFIQQLVMGYVVGILCGSLKTDVTNRVFSGIALTIGIQIGIGVIMLNFFGGRLYWLFFDMRWNVDLFPWVQLFGFLVLLELIVRVLLRLIARLSGLPYRVWRAEVGV